MDIEGLLDLCLRFPWLIALEAVTAFSRGESFKSYVDLLLACGIYRKTVR